MTTFDTDQFVEDCRTARDDTDPLGALREVVARAVAAPGPLESRFDVPLDPDDDGVLLRSPELLITSAIFPKGFSTGIHDHTVAAVIGVWSGAEDNLLYERRGRSITALPATRVVQGEVLVLGRDAVHDVHVPTHAWSGALHVYLGDIFEADRSEWATPSEEASTFDGARLQHRWTDAARATGLVSSSGGAGYGPASS